jgi:hypothetical protein
MSEYQYYEFQAIDRPLAEQEMRELRSYSTRANITPTSFTVDYSWGDFKGDEDAWMAKYFDGPVTELMQRFLKERSADGAGPAQTGRTVGQLLSAAEAHTAETTRLEAEKRAEAKARDERKAAIARKKHLRSLVGREPMLWAGVDTLIATKQPKSYDLALKLLVDLRDLDASAKGCDCGPRIEALRQTPASKPAFIKRLRQAGL